MKRLAVVCTHPIQYYAPVFRLLAARGKNHLRIFYTWGNTAQEQYDPGFGKHISWDIPLLEGYEFIFVPNTSKKPGSNHFWGIVNPTLYKEVIAWQPDVVLIYGWSYYSHLQLMWRLNGKIPIWFRGDSHLLDSQPLWKSWLKQLVLRQIFSWVDKAFYVGTENKRYYLAYGLKEAQLVFAPHAIDNARFADTPAHQYAQQALLWRRELGFSPEDIVLLFVGKLEPKKNPLLLLNAMLQYNQLNSSMAPLKLLFVGNGEMEQVLKSQAKANPNIIFIDFQNQRKMPIVYRLGNILCLPSQGPGETWGLVVNEAMACNLPVIVSNRVGCGTDLVKEDLSGQIFRFDDEADLLRVLKETANAVYKGIYQDKPQNLLQIWSFEHQVQAFEQQLNHYVS